MSDRLSREDRELFYSVVLELSDYPSVQNMKKYVQHGTVSTYVHCLRVARKSLILARRFNISVNERELLRGAMLHDYFLYDWHTKGDHLHGYHHPHIAAHNAARDFDLSPREIDIIKSHMWPLTLFHVPRSKEAFIVCLADKLCSTDETVNRRN